MRRSFKLQPSTAKPSYSASKIATPHRSDDRRVSAVEAVGSAFHDVSPCSMLPRLLGYLIVRSVRDTEHHFVKLIVRGKHNPAVALQTR